MPYKTLPPVWWLRVCRYADLVLMAVVGILVVSLLWHRLEVFTTPCIDRIVRWPVFFRYGTGVLPTAILWLVIKRLGGLSWHHVFSKRLWLYPPTWLAGMVGFLAFECWAQPRIQEKELQSQAELTWHAQAAAKEAPASGEFRFLIQPIHETTPFLPSFEQIAFVTGGFVLLGLILCAPWRQLWTKMPFRKPKNLQVDEPKRSILDDPVALERWIEDDRPITSQEQDFFGITHVARRIATVLLTERTRAVGLLGLYGHGKSSTLNLVEDILIQTRKRNKLEDELRAQNKSPDQGAFLIARLDAWGRSDDAIPTSALKAAVKALSTKMDCLALARLPESYAFAMGKHLPWWLDILVQLGFPSETPHDGLRRLDKVLKASKLRTVIFAEDIERNADDATCEKSLPAFLDRLRNLECVSFVFATSGSVHSEIIRRTCQWIEALP